MTSKLRKEFEQFKHNTARRLWLLENPPRFQFNDNVLYCPYNDDTRWKAVYKGESKINEEYWWFSKQWIFSRECFIEVKHKKQLFLTEAIEQDLTPAKD